MIAIVIWASLLVAYTSRHSQVGFRIMILPLILAVVFF